ncbi:MAG: acyltransferase family protein [Massilia sp.]
MPPSSINKPSGHSDAPRSGGRRIHGLDTLRALAVTFVVLHHYTLFVSERSTFGWFGDVGWVGVDLFFALSGYLIGNQIFAAMASPEGFAPGRFYARRLLRTLPNFYVVLALYYCWPWFRDGMTMLPAWRFLSFTQNIGLLAGTGFSHAWSLCIEEQFYMLLPALALLVAAQKRSLRLAWFAIGAGLAMGFAARAWFWLHEVEGQQRGLAHYYTTIYYSSLCRLDELLAGVALAVLKNFHKDLWARLVRRGDFATVAGGLVLGLVFAWSLHDRYAFAVTLFGYPLLALGFGLLVLAALDPTSRLGAIRVPGAERLALWSYAIYLVHKQVCILAARPFADAGYGPESALTIGACLALSVACGALLYYLVESPFMALRTRFVPQAPSPAVSASLQSH